MDQRTSLLLRELNRAFYERHAADFAATRDHPWPGWGRVVAQLDASPRLLDAGCGNGRFAAFLADRGRRDVDYTGIDTSEALLGIARERTRDWATSGVHFHLADLLEDDELPAGPFDAVVLFGVLHHVPGFEARSQLVARLGRRLAPDGFLAATLWRFGEDPRVLGRTRGWGEGRMALPSAELEPGDHLLRWGDANDVVRYCHFVDDEEVTRLIRRTAEAGLALTERFRSDGRSGDLNEYLVWRRDAR